jgi:hypothetical protein
VGNDGKNAFLLTDGNHRVAAMIALGYKYVLIRQDAHDRVSEAECDYWPGVSSGRYKREDALGIFQAYFSGNSNYRTASRAAPIIHDISHDLASATE